MAEKFPTSTDEAQSSFSQTEMRDAESGEILRQQISSRLENNYTSDGIQYMTAIGSKLSVPASNSSTDIQTQITMSTRFPLEETTKVIDASRPDITQPVNTLCNISDTFSYRELSRDDPSNSSDGSSSGDSDICRDNEISELASLSCQDAISPVTKDHKHTSDAVSKFCATMDSLKDYFKNMSTNDQFRRYYEKYFFEEHPYEISSSKKPSESPNNSFTRHVRRSEETFPNGSFAGPSKNRTEEFMSSSGCLGGVTRKLRTNLPPNNKKIDVHISNLHSSISSTEFSVQDNAMETREESQNHHSPLVANTATGGSDLSDFTDCFRKSESEQPANISPIYPCHGTQIWVNADMNSGRDQSTSDNRIDAKPKFLSTLDLIKSRVPKRFPVDEPLDSRKSKCSRLETNQTSAVRNSSSDSCIQMPLLMDEDISCENSYLQYVDQMNKKGEI